MKQALFDTFWGLRLMIVEKAEHVVWKLKHDEGSDLIPMWFQLASPVFGAILVVLMFTSFNFTNDPWWGLVLLGLFLFAGGGLIASFLIGVLLLCLIVPMFWLWKVFADAHYAGKRHRESQEYLAQHRKKFQDAMRKDKNNDDQ